MAKSNIGVMQLQTDKKFDDVAFHGDRNCYKYYVQSSENDMILKVQQYSGLISFTVNPKKPAESYDSASFQHVGTSNTNLVISANDRKKSQQQKGLYYICAVPHMTSTYSIMVSEPSKNQKYTFLEDGYDENGQLQGSNMTLYVYKVPPLEYQGEDISISFRVTTISGEKPILAAAFCQDTRNFKLCVQNLTKSEVLGTRSSYQKANIVGKDLTLTIDHDERTCQDVYNSECYYIVAVIGQSPDEEFTNYEIKVMHAQLNYYQLSEGNMLTDYVNLGNYRYYSFTLMNDPKVKKVSFILSTLHGDADIYVSRTHRYPNKIDYEKSSAKTNSLIDEVSFEDKNLSTTYYIGVYSFQYSTYNLVVKVEREGQNLMSNIPLLSEGIPFQSTIIDEKNQDFYKIVVKQIQGYEKSIKIQLQQLKGKVDFYVNYNEPPTNKKFIWSSSGGPIEIQTTDKNFHREGTYYVGIYPRQTFWNQFTRDEYKYIISYTTKDSFTYLQAAIASEIIQKQDTYQYFRHFVTKKTLDIAISMTVFNGNPQLYLSLTPQIKSPNASEHDLNTWNQYIISGSKSKALYLSYSELVKSNPVCSVSIGTNADVEPCAIYMGVYCGTDCKYSLKLSYQRDAPQQLIVGVPQHDLVKQGDFIYYYLIAREGKTKQIYGVLNSLTGNADLYVRFQDNPHIQPPEQWLGPSESEYALKSTELLKQDMLIIKPSDLQHCFSRFKSDDISFDEKQCAIVFGVYAPQNLRSEEDQTRFNFVVYSDVTYLTNGSPVSGKVDEKEFQYYVFDALCKDCPIVVSVSTYSSGDPDLYIKFGDSSLPSLNSYDLQSSTFQSELMRIDLEMQELKDKKIKSLQGPIIVGVYGKKKSDFQISVTQEKNPITPLISGYSLKISQTAFETTYFMYYHIQDEKDFKLSLGVRSGKVDLLMSTFVETEDNQNFAERLPKSKRNAQWSMINIGSTSSVEQKEILILNNERNYCQHCYYLIGVSSQEQRAEYTILAHSLDADYQNAQLLKIGENNHLSVKAQETKVLRFIIDEFADFQVIVNMASGYTFTYINFVESKEDPIADLFGTSTFTVKTDSPYFHTGKVYYLIMEGQTDCEFYVLINQQKQIVQLTDGVPQKVQYMNKEDISKLFIYRIPDGDSNVQIQMQSQSDRFFPYFYLKFYEDIDSVINDIQFPPSGEAGFQNWYNWDKNYKILNWDRKFSDIKGGKAGLAINVFAGHSQYDLDLQPNVLITATSASILKIVGGQTYLGQFKHKDQYVIYQSDDFIQYQQGYVIIEFASCFGNPKIDILNSVTDRPKYDTMGNFYKREEFGRTYYTIPLPRENLFLMIRPDPNLNENGVHSISEYFIKTRYGMHPTIKNVNYYFQGTNKLDFSDYSERTKTLNVSWNQLYWADTMGGMRVTNSNYKLIVTKQNKVRLDSICALRQNVTTSIYHQVYMTNETSIIVKKIEPDTKYYMNVFGFFKTTSDQESEVVPYEVIEIYFQHNQETSYFKFLILIGVLFLLFGFAFWIMSRLNSSKNKTYYREKGPSKHIEYELTNVKSSNTSVGEYQRPTELIKDIETEQLTQHGVEEPSLISNGF